MKKKFLAGAMVALMLSTGVSTSYAFNEIEDLSRAGTLGNKEEIPMPVTEWENITIMGDATLTQEQMKRFILNHNPHPKINCTLDEMVNLYYTEAEAEGVRPDVALCQALKETGFFQYGGDVSPAQNNFCGLGATGNGAPGFSFFSPQRGVRAHIQHLVAYAKKEAPKGELIDPRYEVLVTRYPQYHGTVEYWIGLNGRWAVPGTSYGQEILMLWNEAKLY